MRFTEVNDLHHAFTMLHNARQVKDESREVYSERMYALANDAFAKVDKAIVESQLVGISLICCSTHEGHERKFKNILDFSTICIVRTKFAKKISIKAK